LLQISITKTHIHHIVPTSNTPGAAWGPLDNSRD